MKVLTKVVIIENEEFALITDEYEGKKYYGTIPYSETDENGRLKRVLNGFDMCISFESIEDALEERTNRIKLERFRAEGHTKAEEMMFVVSGYTTDNWDMEMFTRVKEIA
jgi:hypothetical protein